MGFYAFLSLPVAPHGEKNVEASLRELDFHQSQRMSGRGYFPISTGLPALRMQQRAFPTFSGFFLPECKCGEGGRIFLPHMMLYCSI